MVKLYLIINDEGCILAVKVTTGNGDDRNPVPEVCKDLWGSFYGDKGYVSKRWQDELARNDIHFITGKRRNKKVNSIKLWNKFMLRTRFIIEIVFDQLKKLISN